MRTFVYTSLALLAFAANSLLCRLALVHATIDPASFATTRITAGALTLLLVSRRNPRKFVAMRSSWTSAALLFLYAVPFAFAYLTLSAGTGALLLFGAVQVTMMVTAIGMGDRPGVLQWLGLLVAFTGLVYLVAPGLTAPPLLGATLMTLAGISWGIYSLRGPAATDPLTQTASNFLRSVPMAIGVSLLATPHFHVEQKGFLLAVASGALASGMGYVIWYMALRSISAVTAAVVQLLVPVLAAAGGAIFLAEVISLRLVVSAVLVLGGIGFALIGRSRRPAVTRTTA